ATLTAVGTDMVEVGEDELELGSDHVLHVVTRGTRDLPALCLPRAAAAYLVSSRPGLGGRVRPGSFRCRLAAIRSGATLPLALRSCAFLRETLLLLRLHQGDRAGRSKARARPGRRFSLWFGAGNRPTCGDSRS